MKTGKGGISLKNIVSVLSIVSLITVAQGAATTAFAVEWELWPKGRGPAPETGKPAEEEKPKGAVPPAIPETPEAAAAAKAGEAGGKTVAAGISAGTIGKAALIAAGIAAIAIAAGGGGGGGGTTTPAHH